MATQNFAHGGSLFRNYKGTFSLVLFAICDSQYRFLYTSIGCAGSANDAAIWRETAFKKRLDEQQLGLPGDAAPGISYHLVGDDIFGLSQTMMKPFPRRDLKRKQLIFNYRLSRARRVIENAFGILAARFRVFRAPICLKRENTANVIKASVVLHNFLLSECPMYVRATDFVTDSDDLPRFEEESGLVRAQQLAGNKTGNLQARKQRELLSEYFYSNEGALPFQWKMVFGEANT